MGSRPAGHGPVTLPVYISFGRTVLAYALVMSQEIFAAMVRAAERAGADRDIGALPEGYQTLLGPAFIDGTDLSTGQWQRLALADVLPGRAAGDPGRADRGARRQG
jgi:ABC-type multidrug transport system fused ATPase/permease subunit